jgi:hypothetical protein
VLGPLSKLLKPIIEKAKYVVSGTKQLTNDLRNVKLEPGRPFKIITGDIVAYYPNIPIDNMMKVMRQIWGRYYAFELSPEERASGSYPDIDTFEKILTTAMTSLIVEGHDGVAYRQIRGLAMGVACSPDIANLYGDFFEREWIHQAQCVAFYKRYIDDIFAIVYTDQWDPEYTGNKNPKDYMDATIAFQGCTIDWEEPTTGLAFLDLWIYIDGDTIQWKPYSKAGNHLERIPWESSHPTDIKRGTFIGELSRLATLSSKLEHYLEAVHKLSNLYVSRGYPAKIVKAWRKQYVLKRWEVKDTPKTDREERVIVLKTVFNDVWDNFNVHDLESHMIQTVRKYTAIWRAREPNTYLRPSDEDFLIPSSALSGKNVDVFVEEFAGNTFSGRVYQDVVGELSDVTAPLLERSCLCTDPDGGMREELFNLLNYEYWIFGDRRFLISRKKTKNLGDMVTRWRKSMVRASFDWSKDPASIMIAQNVQDLLDHEAGIERDKIERALGTHWARDPNATGRDAFDFGQLTLEEAWGL